MPPSWLFVVVLVSVLSQEAENHVFGHAEDGAPNPMGHRAKPGGTRSAASRRPEKTTIRFPGVQPNHPLRNVHLLPSSTVAFTFPASGVKGNKRVERQSSFFPLKTQTLPNSFNRPNSNGGRQNINFPSGDPPVWSPTRPNRPQMVRPPRPPMVRPPRPPMVGPPRPQWGHEPADGFPFGDRPPMWTTKRPRVTPMTTRRPVTAEPAPVTRATPAPTRAGCNCPSTPEFNPVCGGDRVTYSNAGKLKCANYCGNPVKMVHLGSCITSTTSRPTTPPSRVREPPSRTPSTVRVPSQWSWS